MKALVFAILFITLFFNTGFCQKLSHQDLIGTWDKKGQKNEKLSFKFTTSSNVVIESSTKENDNLTYKLITDSIKGQIIMKLDSNNDALNYSTYYSVQRINSDTLKLMNLDYNDAAVQIPGKLKTGTIYLVRR